MFEGHLRHSDPTERRPASAVGAATAGAQHLRQRGDVASRRHSSWRRERGAHRRIAQTHLVQRFSRRRSAAERSGTRFKNG